MKIVAESLLPTIKIFVDGASSGNPGPAGIGIVIYKNDKKLLEKSISIGKTTNNEAEYTALLVGLKNAITMQAYSVNVFSDSELVVKQIKGIYKVKNNRLQKLNKQVRKIIKEIPDFRIIHIPREKNKEADKLAKNAIKHATP